MQRSQGEARCGTSRLTGKEKSITKWCAGALAILTLSVLLPSTAASQIRGGARVVGRAAEWWLSAGGVAAQMPEIVDGRSGTRWNFGGDPLWQLRGAIEKSVQGGIQLGFALAYGDVELRASALDLQNPSTPVSCAPTCPSRMKLWNAMAQFRTGGSNRGFGSSFEGGLGLTGFSNLRTRDTGEPIRGFESGTDFTAVLGGGFSYGFSDTFQVTLVQEFGIGFHSKKDLPDGASSTYRPRNTRFGLRYGF